MAPYPTAHEIEDIFRYRESPDTMSLWDERLAANLDGTVMGHDHHLSGQFKGVDAWKDQLRASIDGMRKATSMEIINVIGGGESPWACVEIRTTGKAKSGEY